MVKYIIFAAGVCCGIVFMCLFQINRAESEAEYKLLEQERMKQEGGFDEQEQ